MTVNQANDTLDAQIVEIQQLTDEREATQAQIDQTSETVARIAKEVSTIDNRTSSHLRIASAPE